MLERSELILGDLVRLRAEELPERDVLTFEHLSLDGERTPDEVRTYAELSRHADRIAAAPAAHGLERGDRFAVMMRNQPELVETMIAASRSATVFVPVDPRTRAEKLAYLLASSRCRGVVCADYCLPALLAVRNVLPDLGFVLALETGEDPAAAGGRPRRGVGQAVTLGPSLFLGLRSVKTRGGWLRSGDMGWRDAEGWLFFSHRKGGGIRRQGDFVSTGFVEKVIAELPEVSDVFVYGVPAASGAPGEEDVVAAVVPAARRDPRRRARLPHLSRRARAQLCRAGCRSWRRFRRPPPRSPRNASSASASRPARRACSARKGGVKQAGGDGGKAPAAFARRSGKRRVIPPPPPRTARPATSSAARCAPLPRIPPAQTR